MGAGSETLDPEKGLSKGPNPIPNPPGKSKGPNPTPNLPRKSSDSEKIISSINDKWEENLDEAGDVSLRQFEASSDALQWHERDDVRSQNKPNISTGIHLSLLEGLSSERITAFGDLPFQVSKAFFHNHFLDYLPAGRSKPTPNSFFFKWPRRVLQRSERWDRETRIRADKPYDSDTLTDPAKLGLDHQRLKAKQVNLSLRTKQTNFRAKQVNLSLRAKQIHYRIRLHIPDTFGMLPMNAARFSAGKLMDVLSHFSLGVLVFDARRQHIITRKRYVRGKLSDKNVQPTVEDCFVESPTRERFINELNRIGPVKVGKDPERVIMAILSKFIREDYLAILTNFRDALDYVDLAMSNDDILQDAMPNWRALFGRWRKEFPQITRSISDILDHHTTPEEVPVPRVSEHAEDPGAILWLREEFSSIAQDMEVVRVRAKLTFQALMSTMAIVESEKAIAQANTISKLTNLAFFFIPLTLSASLFALLELLASLLVGRPSSWSDQFHPLAIAKCFLNSLSAS
ncbi:hypothetical protein FGG08_007434 [Glutinoglossum americanum]|uniref:Uncharacterized protein n=1 Tax=Glutinoglossum americanum TaxID=1670608 RepID=A0A9P8L0X3_9PEZI|nr:hypothetical protein FGG08_007434 [Glutinoglossum americanum]